MPVLRPEEYDQSYFDGNLATYAHNAGYSLYQRWPRHDLGSAAKPLSSRGEFFLDLAARFKTRHALVGKKVLELGCAKGFVVEDLRSLGVDAWGLDVSQYAIDCAAPAVKPYLYVGDARTYLVNFKRNQFDLLFSRDFLNCITDADLPGLIIQMNRISRCQFHLIDTEPVPEYYNVHPLDWWAAQPFDTGTLLISLKGEQEVVKT
jgi:SAM-dependent methyltransferase